MITSTTNLAKELLRLEREIAALSFQKGKAEIKDKAIWQKKIDALRVLLNEVKFEIDNL